MEGLDIKTYHAPYGLNLEEADAGSGLVAHAPDITLLLLLREDLHPDLTRPAAALSPAEQAGLSSDALERLFAVIEAFRAHEIGHLIISILPQLNGPALGIYDPQSERSERRGGPP